MIKCVMWNRKIYIRLLHRKGHIWVEMINRVSTDAFIKDQACVQGHVKLAVCSSSNSHYFQPTDACAGDAVE